VIEYITSKSTARTHWLFREVLTQSVPVELSTTLSNWRHRVCI